MPNSFLYIQSVLFQTFQLSISTQFKCQKQFYFKQFNMSIVFCLHTVLFQAIYFSISTLFSSFKPIDRIRLGATTPGQSDGNKGVLCISRDLPSDCLVSYIRTLFGEVLPLCWDAVSVFCCPSRLGQIDWWIYSPSSKWGKNYIYNTTAEWLTKFNTEVLLFLPSTVIHMHEDLRHVIFCFLARRIVNNYTHT